MYRPRLSPLEAHNGKSRDIRTQQLLKNIKPTPQIKDYGEIETKKNLEEQKNYQNQNEQKATRPPKTANDRIRDVSSRIRPRGTTSNVPRNIGKSMIEPRRAETITTGKISNYNIGIQIGKGAYAIVKSGVNKNSGQKVAIKVYDKSRIADPQRKTCVNREIRILQRLNHDNIVRLYDTIDTTRQLFLIMERPNVTSD